MTIGTDVALLPRLLAGVGDRPTSRVECHFELHGALPDLGDGRPIRSSACSKRLRSRPRGASFPLAARMRAVASRHRPKVVVPNGSEGEPASKEDGALLRKVLDLLLNGAAIAARAVGAREAVVAISEHDNRGARAAADALRERQKIRMRGEPRFGLFSVPERFISGQSSALVNAISEGTGKPKLPPEPAGHARRAADARPTVTLLLKRERK